MPAMKTGGTRGGGARLAVGWGSCVMVDSLPLAQLLVATAKKINAAAMTTGRITA